MARPRRKDGAPGARSRIAEAMWELCCTVPFSKMSVGMVVHEAGCNRSTFYYHFDGLVDARRFVLLSSGLPEFIERLFREALGG